MKELVDQLSKAKVGYFVFTLGQNSGYYNAPNAVYDKLTGYKAGERCSKRDVPMNGDNSNDELAFVTDLGPKEKSSFQIHLFSDKKGLRNYTSRVYAEMLVIDGQKKNVPIQSMSVLNDGNPYTSLYHHGPAFESELIALRVYFDNRQTVDAYGKFRKGLELKDTQFYPTKEQKKNGYGDDVLWVGTTAGVGTLRGWDGQSPAMITPVAKRTESIRAYGPVRTVVEVKDEGWNSNGSLLNMRQKLRNKIAMIRRSDSGNASLSSRRGHSSSESL